MIIDGTWVRRWKWKGNQRIIKSRMCARGCFDPQKDFLATRSTAASRLSQRMLLSTAAVMREDPESWDVSGAFLKGLTFDRFREIMLKQGIKSPTRAVVLIPPWNVWRHLATADPEFHLEPWEIPLYGLWCNKPIYGLNDAPVAWQLSLGQFLQRNKGHSSKLDDSFYFWKDPSSSTPLKGAMTTHVDDLAVVGCSKFKEELYREMCKEFGSISREHLPFQHCGCQYSKTPTGLKMDQSTFASKLKPSDNPEGSDDRALTPSELTQFRSVLGGLLWLRSTRLDIISEVGTLQSVVTKARVRDLRQANQLAKKACTADKLNLGLHFRHFPPDVGLRIQCIHDASSASKGKSYAQEGMMILLMPELPDEILRQDDVTCSDEDISKVSDYGHLLFNHGGKAKRVSYSTSHAETLSAIGGLESSSMVAVRLTELWIADPNPSLQTLTPYQEQGSSLFPVDSARDCRDFLELATGERSVPQDKLQRLYVLAFKEARATGRIRFLMLTPTEFMLADGLTKVMNPPKLFQFLSTGYVEFGNVTKHPTLMRRLPVLHELQEEDLFKDDASLWKEAYEGRPKVSMQKTAMLATLGLAAKPVTRTLLAMTALTSQVHAATSEAPETTWGESWSFPFFIPLTFILLRTLEYLVTCLCRVAMKSMSTPMEAMPTSLNSPTATPMTRRMSRTPERFMSESRHGANFESGGHDSSEYDWPRARGPKPRNQSSS